MFRYNYITFATSNKITTTKMGTKIYRTVNGQVQKLTPITPQQYIAIIESFTNELHRVIVSSQGRYFLILS